MKSDQGPLRIPYLCDAIHGGWPHDGVIRGVVAGCVGTKDSYSAGGIHS
jgi:hypothetical protein